MGQGRGGKKTPERIVSLLREAVKKSSQSAVGRDTGLTQSAVGRYIKGIGEPSSDTLQRLAAYFGVSVAYLRGESAYDGYLQAIFKGNATDEGMHQANIHNNNESVLELESSIKKFPELWEVFSAIPDGDKKNSALLLFKNYGNLSIKGLELFNERNKK